jgi:DNA-binding HxlR family transcriptional regulator
MSSSAHHRDGGGPAAGEATACESLGEPLSRVMTLLGKRWTGVVLGTLMQGPVHFNDLRRGIPGISDRLLNERLVELAGLGLVDRRVVAGPPLRVQYELTEHGYAIRPAINELTSWAEEHLTPPVDVD